MMDVFLPFFLMLQQELSKFDCDDMNNSKIMENGRSQMKGQFWLINFSLCLFFLNAKRGKKIFFFSVAASLLRLDCKISFLNKMVEN